MLQLIIPLLFLNGAFAIEDWACTQGMASTKVGAGLYQSCGVGEGTEAAAKDRALDAAVTEFNKVCGLDQDCANHAISAVPKRTSCTSFADGYFKCFRMIEVTIGGKLSDAPVSGYSRFKIQKGVSKQDLLNAWKAPSQIVDAGNNFLIFSYIGNDFCVGNGHCSVVLANDRVDHWSDIKFDRSDVLETKSIWDRIMGR